MAQDSPSRPSRSQHPTHSKFIILFLTLLMLSSLAIISLSIRTIPFLKLPTSLHHVTSQISDLKAYSSASASQFFHLATILSMIFIWKQAFSIPGTILLNVLIGAIYGTCISTIFTCFLTAIGSTCAYHMARSIRPIILRLFPTPLSAVERAVDRFKIPGTVNRYDTAELSSYLIIARLLPVVPYAALNLASGVLELPLVPFFWTLVLGSLPYNFLTTQVGDILSTATDAALFTGADHSNLSKIWSNTLLLKLAAVSLFGALPVLFKKQLRESIQALSQTRRSSARLSSSLSLSPLSTNGRFACHQSCREWVSDIGSKRRSLSLDHANLPSHAHPSTPPPPSASIPSPNLHLDHSDDHSDLSRTTSSSSLSTEEQERSLTSSLVINFEPLTPDETPGPQPEMFSVHRTAPSTPHTNQIAIRQHAYSIINHPLPLFLTKTSQVKPNSSDHPRNPHLSIHSLFDLPYRKAAKIVSDNLVLPK